MPSPRKSSPRDGGDDIEGMRVVLSAPATLASVGIGTQFSTLASRRNCFILVRERMDEDGNFGFLFTVNVDRGEGKSSSSSPTSRRRMSTSFRQLLVDRTSLISLVRAWRSGNYEEKTGGKGKSGPGGRRNEQFFDGRAVDAEMKAWIDTGVPPSRGSILRFIIWRIILSEEDPGGLALSGISTSSDRPAPVRKSSFTQPALSHVDEGSGGVGGERAKEGKGFSRRGSTSVSFVPGQEAAAADAGGGGDREGRAPETPRDYSLGDIGKGESPEIMEDYQMAVTMRPFQENTEQQPPPSPKAVNLRPFKGQSPRTSEAAVDKPPIPGPSPSPPTSSSPPGASQAAALREQQKKLAGKFPPRRNSLSVVPKDILNRTGGAFADGGPRVKVDDAPRRDARVTDGGKTLEVISKLNKGEGPKEEPERKAARMTDAGATRAAIAQLDVGEGPKEEPERKAARMTDAGATRAAIAQLDVGEGPKEEPERKAARMTDAGATRAAIAQLDVGEGPKEEPERKAARMTDAGATRAAIAQLDVGEGPKEEPERKAARMTDAGATRAAIAQLDVGEGPKEEADRRDARMTDAGATRAAIAQLDVGEGPKEEADRRDARMTDAGATRAAIAQLDVGEGPKEEADRRDARVTDNGNTMAAIAELDVGEGPKEEADRRDARMTDAGATRAAIAQLDVGEGPSESTDRRDARVTDNGNTMAAIAELDVGDGPSESTIRRDARVTDNGNTMAAISELDVGDGPSESTIRRDARITDAGASLQAISELHVGEGPQEVAERRDARFTDAGATKSAIAQLHIGEGPQEVAERRDARFTDAGATKAAIAQLHVGEGPQEVAERRDARFTDAGATKSAIAQLHVGEGAQEVAERRDARFTDAGATKAAIAQLHVGEGPQEVAERRDARFTDAGATKAAISQLHIGEGPQEVAERRDARFTDAGATKAAISQLHIGEGPQEVAERRDARFTDAGATKAAISQLHVGEGPVTEGMDRRLARTTDFGQTMEKVQQLNFSSPGKLEVDTIASAGASDVQFKDIRPSTHKTQLSNTTIKYSPHPQPSFHVPPEETMLPEVVSLDKFINSGWVDSGRAGKGTGAGSGRTRPGTAPAANIVRFPGAFDFKTTVDDSQTGEHHTYDYGTNNYDSSENLFVNIPERPKSSGRASPTTPLTAGRQAAASLDKLRFAALPTELKARQRVVQKQRYMTKMRTVSNPFGVHAGRAANGVSFGPNPHKYDVVFKDPAEKKRAKKKKMDKNFVYDRHGRRHKLVKRQDEVSSGSAKEAMMAGLHLQNAYQVLADAGKRLKGDPRPKLREWKKSGIGRQEFQEALEFVGARKLPEEGIEALWQEMREGESFNEELQDEEGNNGSISVNALLFKILHRDKLKRRLKDSFIYNKGYNFVVNKFKPYDLRESDVVKSIVSVRHVSHAFLDLRLKDVEDWEIEAICYYVSSLLGKERKIGSSKIVQVDLLVAFLRKECDAEELDFENDREAKARTTVDRGDTVTTGELTAIQRHPEKFLKSMENLQRKMERLVKKAAENDTAGRLPGLV
ncbi:hypothetical protein TrCOL_g785 [Triparma columacea]|uniref:Uncharacterized protein n=1 Tax=Triparma columacea TaxID=722753 RepID=A0A9W7G5Y7_9STRA|nr:hypothetical protein TrCOL_g785 [Triparma columacea]